MRLHYPGAELLPSITPYNRGSQHLANPGTKHHHLACGLSKAALLDDAERVGRIAGGIHRELAHIAITRATRRPVRRKGDGRDNPAAKTPNRGRGALRKHAAGLLQRRKQELTESKLHVPDNNNNTQNNKNKWPQGSMACQNGSPPLTVIRIPHSPIGGEQEAQIRTRDA